MTTKLRPESISKRVQLFDLLTIFAGLWLTGCNGRVSVPATVPVTGVVKIKGKPARGIRVTFHNKQDDQTGVYIPVGQTGRDGVFTMSTGAPNNGAPVGEYTVTFEMPIIDARNPIETEIDGLRGKYGDPAQSPWKVTIQEGVNELGPFELE